MVVNGNNIGEAGSYYCSLKEEKNMINTAKFKMFGQLEDQADAGDIEAFVFRNGEVVPASQAENSTGPVIHTAPEKNYGQMEEVASYFTEEDTKRFIFRSGTPSFGCEKDEFEEFTNNSFIQVTDDELMPFKIIDGKVVVMGEK